MNDFTYDILIIVVATAVTALVRFLPFLLFAGKGEPPKWVAYLGKVLPPAVMSVLIIYCLRNVNFLGGNHGIPELLCLGVAIGLHAWKGNVLLSIGGSTVLYMVLIQLVFV